MTVRDPGRIPVGLFEGASISDDAVLRLSAGASRIVAFADAAKASAITAQWSRVAPAVEVEVVPAVSDIREAIIECAKRKVIWVATPTPKNAGRFVAGALQGAAAATEFEIPSVAVHVLRDDTVEGSVAWLTQTGEMSGYGVLYAAAVAAMGGRSVTLISPTAVRAPRTPEALEAAERYIEQSGIEILRLSDPSPLQRVLGGEFGAVVHPVLDAPGGRSLLHPGELPAKSVADGNAAAVVELIEKASGDVIAVFDGVHLVYGGATAAKIAASVALGVVALTGVGAAVAPAAMAAEPPPASAPAAPGTSAEAQTEGVSVTVTGQNGMAHPGTAHVVNRLDTPVTLSLSAIWSHSGNHPPKTVPLGSPVTIGPGESLDFTMPRPEGQAQGGYHPSGIDLKVLGPDGRVLVSGHATENKPFPGTLPGVSVPPEQLAPQFRVVTGTLGPTIDGHGQVPDIPSSTGKDVSGHGAIPTAIPTPKPKEPGPTAIPKVPAPQEVQVPNVVPPKVPDQVPTAIPKVPAPQEVQVPNVVPPKVPDQVPTAIPKVPAPQEVQVPNVVPPKVPDRVPTAIPKVPAPQEVQVPNVVPPKVPDQVPTAIPPITQQTPGQVPQVPDQVPTAIPQATPQSVPDLATQTPGTGTQIPGGGQVTTSTTGTGTTTPGTIGTGTPTEITHTGTTHAATHPGATTHAARHTTGGPTETQTAGRPSELAHTGAGETGLLAGLAAALMAAGAGIVVAARRRADDREEELGDASS